MNQLLRDSISPELTNFEPVNLTNCDREPIHIPGKIQPHGILFVLREPGFQIVQVSENAHAWLGVPSADLLNRPLSDILFSDPTASSPVNGIKAIQACLDRSFEHTNPLPLNLLAANGEQLAFNGIVHRAPSGEVVLELEPLVPVTNSNFYQFYHYIKGTLEKMHTAQTLEDLCELIVQDVRRMTGFDRVMIYRFNAQGDGTVIAEAKQPDMETFLGLHYPSSDVPKPAKHLYTLNWLRLIADVNCSPVGLIAALPSPSDASDTNSPAAVAPLDMSYCSLRAVSPIHLEYLRNMGVAASMSVSLIQQNQLWGLIACHHNSPKFLPYEIRTVCEFLGQLMSTELPAKEANAHLDYKLHLKTLQGRFIERLSHATNLAAGLTTHPEDLMALTGSQGAAICEGETWVCVGQTPSETVLRSLIPWLSGQFQQDVFVTAALPSLYPLTAADQAIASGVLALTISKIQHRYILWFRAELPQTVTWAGNPDKPQQIEADGSLTLLPRRSFAAWQEIVQGQSAPWLDCEIAVAMELRQAIVDIVVRQADELAIINLELERSNTELDAFAYIASHDLKEPLRGIHNYATFLLEDYGAVLEEDGIEKLHTLVRLTQRMEALIESLLRYSRLGRQELQMNEVDLNRLLRNVAELFQMHPKWENCTIRIPQELPAVRGDIVLIEEIFTNLISNGFKYNDQPEKWVEIGWLNPPPTPIPGAFPEVSLYVRDNGIGIREKHLESVFRIFKRLHTPGKYGGGTGAGLTIVKKIVERHGGHIRVESTYGQGTTFWLTLPSAATVSLES